MIFYDFERTKKTGFVHSDDSGAEQRLLTADTSWNRLPERTKSVFRTQSLLDFSGTICYTERS